MWFGYPTADMTSRLVDLNFFRTDRRSLVERLVYVASFALFFYRYFNRDLCPFINDEPVFLSHSRTLWLTHTFATYSPLVGTQGVHYGPAALWLYTAIHAVFGSTVDAHILVMLTLFTASNIALTVAIGRFFGDRYLIPATLGALVASSPYQFLWSRVAWDPLANVCTGFIVALLCTRAQLSLWRAMAIGAFIGIGVSTHPAMLPLSCVALGLTLLRSASKQRLRNTVAAFLVALFICLPYLHYLATAQGGGGPSPKRAVSFELVRVFFSQALRVSSISGMPYFLDEEWKIFGNAWPILAAASDKIGEALPALSILFAVGLVASAYLVRAMRQRIMVLGAICVWAGYLLFYSYLQLYPHPHYQFSIWWATLVPIAAILGRLKEHRRIYVGAIFGIASIALFQFFFLVRFVGFLEERQGTRGIHYDAPVGQQIRIVQELCSHPQHQYFVVNRTQVFPHSLQYVALVEPSCSGKQVTFVSRHSPHNANEAAYFTLDYASPDTASLKLTPTR